MEKKYLVYYNMSNIPLKLKNIDPDLIDFSELKKNQAVKTLKMAFIKYKKRDMIVQFPSIAITSYGFPKLDQFHTQEQRDYIKLPIDPESVMYKTLITIDEALTKQPFKQYMFGDKHEKFEYSPIVKYPSTGCPYVKVKLCLSYPEREIQTQVLLNSENVDVGNVDDFAKVVKFRSDVVCMIKFTKLWNVNTKYGLTLTLLKIDCTHNLSFMDDDDDEIQFLDESDDD